MNKEVAKIIVNGILTKLEKERELLKQLEKSIHKIEGYRRRKHANS
tara:strand:+ start:165 stop:302 length:138 start_codon:yes stop_codon:yes gene_type:complete